MSAIEWMASVFAGLGLVYLAARLISAAYFNSKQQHEERRKNHG